MGFVVVQVSKCEGDFTANCVIATNYQLTNPPRALANISWALDFNSSETVIHYYIRLMALNEKTIYSMEISFDDNQNRNSYPFTNYFPFDGAYPSGKPSQLTQYWKVSKQFTIPNNAYQFFAVAYCNQGYTPTGIDIAVTTPADDEDYSLVRTWACPQTIPISECNPIYAEEYYCAEVEIASFVLLPSFNLSDPVILAPKSFFLGQIFLISFEISSNNLVLFSKLPPYTSSLLLEIFEKN